MAKKFCQNSLFNDNIQKWKVNEMGEKAILFEQIVFLVKLYPWTRGPPEKVSKALNFELNCDAFVRDNK